MKQDLSYYCVPRTMIIFDKIDRKLAKFGFHKMEETEYGAMYERRNDTYKFTQCVHVQNKSHLKTCWLHSYDKDLFDEKKIGNTNVALSYEEVRLFQKKMKKIIKAAARREK